MEKHADQLSERFLVFASNIISLVKRIDSNQFHRHIGMQLFRSATAIGVNSCSSLVKLLICIMLFSCCKGRNDSLSLNSKEIEENTVEFNANDFFDMECAQKISIFVEKIIKSTIKEERYNYIISQYKIWYKINYTLNGNIVSLEFEKSAFTKEEIFEIQSKIKTEKITTPCHSYTGNDLIWLKSKNDTIGWQLILPFHKSGDYLIKNQKVK